MRLLTENPVAALLEVRRQREEPITAGAWALLILVGFGFPGVGMGLLDHLWPTEVPLVLGSHLGAFLSVAGFLILLAVPWLAFRVDASMLLSFRRGRCFEEILGTPTTAAEVVDGVLLHTTRSLAVIAAPALLALGLSVPFTPPETQGAWLVAGGLWAVACLATVQVISILIVLFASWSEGGDDLNPLLAAALGGTLAPAALLVGVAFTQDASSPTGMALVGVALVWTVLAGRALGLYGFAHFYDLARWQRKFVRRLSGTGARTAGSWSDNPIVLRECRREARSVPPGLLLFARHAPVLPAGLLLLAPAWLPLGLDGAEPFWLGVALATLFLALRAAGRTVDLLVEESEGRTWETLLGTRLGTRELMEGFAQVGWVPRMLDGLLLSPVAVWLGLQAGVGWDAVAAPIVLMLAPVAGAWSGLGASARGERRDASRSLVMPLAATVYLSLVIWVIVVLLGGLFGVDPSQVSYAAVLSLAVVALVQVVRGWALSSQR